MATAAGACPGPAELSAESLGAHAHSAATVPGTVAMSVAPDAGLDEHVEYDTFDWWYRCPIADPRDGAHPEARVRLRLDGLATLAEVWFNGTLLLSSNNMFVAHEVDVTELLGAENEIVIAFRSLASALEKRKPRPPWKTQLVENQRLRWFRTTLLGRIPGWTPRIQPVGPWRPVWLQVVSGPTLNDISLNPEWVDGHGRLLVDADLAVPDDVRVESASALVGDRSYPLEIEESSGGWRVHGALRVADVEPWWPRTHGTPQLYSCQLHVETSRGPSLIDCDRVGFRSIELDSSDGRVQFVVNGVPIHCRGACWTTNDIISLVGDPTEMRRTLQLAADAHANMIRVGGTMVYETDDFYRACDELGLMVWQDFMFANMAYPFDDPDFAASATAEARQQSQRLGLHASVVAFCGGSEIEQQAAMFGAPGDVWLSSFFTMTLPGLVQEHGGSRPYWTSTPTGGALPFQTASGLSHYYGVGAYLRPVEDCRLAPVKFTPECLGFSHVPEDQNLRTLLHGRVPPPHHPAWKTGVPRDSGAGWDFEDVRDHYLEELYGCDPAKLRSHDLDRYNQLSRTVTGRVMARVVDEWRSPDHPCAGALIWFLQDLRPGAGWGLVDSENRPKPAYYYLKRAWAPIRVCLLDRGLDGLRVEIHNETARDLEGELELVLLGRGPTSTTRASQATSVPARGSVALHAEEMLGHFADPTYAYRFGPQTVIAVSARWTATPVGHAGATPMEYVSDHFWPTLQEPLPDTVLQADAEVAGEGLRIGSDRLARDIRIELKDGEPADNYFDLLPGESSVVSLTIPPSTELRGFVSAENERDGVRIRNTASG